MSADGSGEMSTQRDSDNSNDSGNVVLWAVSVLVVAVVVIIFMAPLLRSWVRNNIGISMSLGAAVLIVFVVVVVVVIILFKIFQFSDSSPSGSYGTQTGRYNGPRCSHKGQRSRLQCILPFGHSGHHRYR